jgi:hypothetical protein
MEGWPRIEVGQLVTVLGNVLLFVLLLLGSIALALFVSQWFWVLSVVIAGYGVFALVRWFRRNQADD